MPKAQVVIFWFRRDLRLEDNAGLYHALKSGYPVLPVFIFDTHILCRLENKKDRRVDFIHQCLEHLQEQLKTVGSSLFVFYGTPEKGFKKLWDEYEVKGVYTNHDYEPHAIKRDDIIKNFAGERKIEFHSYKDQVIFEKDEVTKEDGKPYTVFTPYSKKWKSRLNDFYLKSYPTKKYFRNFFQTKPFRIPSLKEIGFENTDIKFAEPKIHPQLIKNYINTRDIPALNGTSHIGIHVRFGTGSIRKLVQYALKYSETWLNELIWREFFMQILYHFPHSATNSFRKEYDRIRWRNNEAEFKKWRRGETGFPIVDAGMRELNATGFMHNRVRMIAASFLVKDLLIDWRWGEAYFASKLNDYDMSANIGNWQWSAGCGCDAAPYFRIFNPDAQQKKFDPELTYIKKWVPEFGTDEYPEPIVDHKEARERTLSAFKKALND